MNKIKFIFLFIVFLFTVSMVQASELVAWGWNQYGQTDIPAGDDFVAIDSGVFHSLALKSDGSIVSWGGDSGPYWYYGNESPPNGTDFVAIAASPFHSLALKSDGSIVGWGGRNYYGETNSPNGSDFVAISVGGSFSLALKSDGSIVGWGKNDDGQATPPSGNDYTAIAGGDYFSLALKSDGSIVGWGKNDYGQASPPSGNDYVAIAAGRAHALALKSDGSIVGWGRDDYGQASPPSGNDYTAIAAGEGAFKTGGEFSLALKSDGSIVGWGHDDYTQASPPSGNYFVAVDAGARHGLALRSVVVDSDEDGVSDEWDNCPLTSNPSQADCNSNGVGDACDGVNPAAQENCDGVDNNCNGQIDEGFDQDSDSYTSCQGDCNDNNANINPSASEVCDSIDNDCNNFIDDGVCGGQCIDSDNDGYGVNNDASCTNSGFDCNDNSRFVNPGETESCSTPYDDDCSGTANNGCDNDGDGYSVPNDCNDGNDAINPGAEEVCNNIDDDCDSQVDEFISGCIDIDEDGIVDSIDICPVDPNNLCNVNATQKLISDTTSTVLSTPNGETSVAFNPGDVSVDTVITVEKNNEIEPNFALTTQGGSEARTVYSYTFSPEGIELASDVTITMNWKDEDNDGKEDTTNHPENQMDIYWYNPSTEIWEAQNSNCDLVNNYCTLVINHFSDYVLAGAVDGDGDGYTRFDCDDADASIYPGAPELCDGKDNNCNYQNDEVVCGDPTDADCDGVNDCSADYCLESILPDNIPELVPNNYADIDGDSTFETVVDQSIIDSQYTMEDTYGCTCSDILICEPGINEGEQEHGCSEGTINVWIKQIGWAKKC
ncbi:MopE-related protein [Bacteroidota bacterium]